MKIALYIEDGIEQIVLTPDSPSETALLGKLHDGTRELSIYRGSFYGCAGGWVRHAKRDDSSTMIVLRPKHDAVDPQLYPEAGADTPHKGD